MLVTECWIWYMVQPEEACPRGDLLERENTRFSDTSGCRAKIRNHHRHAQYRKHGILWRSLPKTPKGKLWTGYHKTNSHVILLPGSQGEDFVTLQPHLPFEFLTQFGWSANQSNGGRKRALEFPEASPVFLSLTAPQLSETAILPVTLPIEILPRPS